MADSYTTNYNFTKPEIGLSDDTWGQKLNDNFDALDTVLASLVFPVGSVVPSARASATIPGWLVCQGQAVSRTEYAQLFAAIGTSWGSGNGSTTFNVPDLRGVFVRGFDAGRGIDPSRVVLSQQAAAFASHTHTGAADSAGEHSHAVTGTAASAGSHTHSVTGTAASAGAHTHTFSHNNVTPQTTASATAWGNGTAENETTSSAGAHTHSVTGTAAAGGTHTHSVTGTAATAGAHTHALTIGAAGGTETRPVNVAMNFYIKT